jgi:hypothetical protein
MTTEQLAQYIQLFKQAGILKDAQDETIEAQASPVLTNEAQPRQQHE